MAASQPEVAVVTPGATVPGAFFPIDGFECWRPVAGYEGLYEVSDLGRVRSFFGKRQGLMLRPACTGGSKYLRVVLHRNGSRKDHTVHRLVAEAFVPGFLPGLQVNHKNGDTKFNRSTNLEWITHRENMHHARHVLGRKYAGNSVRATWPCGKTRTWACQRDAEIELRGKATGGVSWSLKSGRRIYGAEWAVG